ncbi:hypothetical protein GGR04_001937 [Aureimonas pseudogalii]|uniref:Uncharacterized protein n=1 Tax=Aureimonas pseudogalii TaxID=1744844 RepID=A0A7W6EHA8_9HYPH|nr:hypothetical protein [Aureimonas pseudogalii]
MNGFARSRPGRSRIVHQLVHAVAFEGECRMVASHPVGQRIDLAVRTVEDGQSLDAQIVLERATHVVLVPRPTRIQLEMKMAIGVAPVAIVDDGLGHEFQAVREEDVGEVPCLLRGSLVLHARCSQDEAARQHENDRDGCDQQHRCRASERDRDRLGKSHRRIGSLVERRIIEEG